MPEIVTSLFVVGSWLFWIILVAFSILAMVASENDDYGGPLILGTIIVCVLFGGGLYSILTELISPRGVLIAVICYVACGMAWTLIKWWRYVAMLKPEVSSYNPENDKYGSTAAILQNKLSANKNKGRIIAWGVYWPWSMLWSVIHESAETAFLTLVNQYNKIAGGTLKELEEKLKK